MPASGEDEHRASSVSATGRNAAIAAGAGLIAAIVVSAAMTVASTVFDSEDGRVIDLVGLSKGFIMQIPGLFLCFGPVVFVPVFANLQRVRFGG